MLDVLGVLCNSFPLVAVMEGGQPDMEPQSSMPTRAPQVPGQVPLSTENTSAKTGASKMCVLCVVSREGMCTYVFVCAHIYVYTYVDMCACVCMCVDVWMYLPMCAY